MNDNVFENGSDFIYGRVIEESRESDIEIKDLEEIFHSATQQYINKIKFLSESLKALESGKFKTDGILKIHAKVPSSCTIEFYLEAAEIYDVIKRKIEICEGEMNKVLADINDELNKKINRVDKNK